MSSNSLINASVIAKESMFQLENNSVMAMCVHKEYKKEFAKVGDTISIRKPVKFESTDGATLNKQDVKEGSVSLQLNTRKHVGWGFETLDLTLTVEQYAERYIQPAGIRLANDIDAALTGLYPEVWNSAGTPGTTPSTFEALAQAAQYMDDAAVPDDGSRKLVLNPKARWAMAGGLKGIYDNSMPRDLVRRGLLGTIANFQIYGDQNIRRHTCGTRTNTALDCLVKGANQHSNSSPQANTQSLIIDDSSVAGATIKAGDVFSIADVYEVNPVSKISTGRLKQFTVTTDVTLVAGAGTLTIAPAIVTSGAFQNVDSVPADDAGITFIGAASSIYPQNLAFHKNCFALVTVPMMLPDGVAFKSRIQHDGISLRVVKDYSVIDDEDIIRIDLLAGVKTIYPDLGVRLWG